MRSGQAPYARSAVSCMSSTLIGKGKWKRWIKSLALRQRLRLGVANAFVHISFHLPFVLRMRFAYINCQKVRLSLVIVIEIAEVAYLAARYSCRRPGQARAGRCGR